MRPCRLHRAGEMPALAKSCNRSESSRPIVCLKGDLSSHFAFLKRQHVGVLSAERGWLDGKLAVAEWAMLVQPNRVDSRQTQEPRRTARLSVVLSYEQSRSSGPVKLAGGRVMKRGARKRNVF